MFKKSGYILVILTVFTFFGSMAIAGPGGVPGPPIWGGPGGPGGHGGQGGNATVGDITNTNTNTNANTNINNNNPYASAFSGSSSSATGGNVSMVIEDTPDHIRGPEIVSPDVKLVVSNPSIHKTVGSIMDRMKSCTLDQAKLLAKGANDAVITPAVMVSNDFVNVGHLNIGNKSGVFMGYLYANSDGSEVTAAGLEGAAMAKALNLGATGIVKIHNSISIESIGSAWNVGIGGGGSVLSDGGHTAVAPNGGTGYGKARASNECHPEMVFEIYCDESILVKKDKYPEVNSDISPLFKSHSDR